MIQGFSNNSLYNSNIFSSDKSEFEQLRVNINEKIESLKNNGSDINIKEINEEEVQKLFAGLGIQTEKGDMKILAKFMNLSPVEKMLLLMEIAFEIQRRLDKGITTPYYQDKQFTDQIKKQYGIDIYGSNMLSVISMLSPEALGIISKAVK